MFDPTAHPALAGLAPRLRELAGDAAYKAGRDYHKKRLVRQATVAGTAAFATVTGSTDYRISVAFGADEPKVSCTCPAHRRSKYCKHVVAVVTALLEEPGSFVESSAPEPEATPSKKARAPKQPKADKAAERAAGLSTLDSLLDELAAGGLVTLGPEQAQQIAGAGELVRALKLRRLGNQIMRLQRAAAGAAGGLEAGEFAALLRDICLTRAATGAHLEGLTSLDPALAEDLLGKVWRESDLEPVRGMELVEVAATRESDGEFAIETGYLCDLATGELFTEKLITPARMAGGAARQPYRHRLLVDEAGLYPGLAPRRIKLIRVRRGALGREHAAALVGHALTEVADLRRRLSDRLATPFGPAELPVLFRPAALVTQGALNGALDTAGRFLAVDLPEPWVKELPALLPEPGGYALCGLLREEGAGLGLTCLSMISPDLRWWRGPIFPDGTVRSRR